MPQGLRSRALNFFRDKGGAPGIGELLGVRRYSRCADEPAELLSFLADVLGGIVSELTPGRMPPGAGLPESRRLVSAIEKPTDAASLALVALLQRRADLLVVALDGREGLVGEPGGNEFRRRAQQAVADPDVVIEEGERLAGFQGFQPQAHPAQLDGHGVDVHAVEAAADDVAEGGAGGLGAGFLLAGAGRGHAPRQAMGGGDQEVAGADGRVADLEV